MAANELYTNVTLILNNRRMQQKDLAEKMGVAPAALSKALTGNPTLDTIRKIAKALDAPISTLLEERNTIDGYIRINGKTYHVISKHELENLIENI